MTNRDRMADVERRLQEVEDTTARLPVTQATSTPAEPPTILLGQATAAVSSSTTLFTIDNVIVVQGTDPRPTPVNPTQTVQVKNTFADSLENNQRVYAIRSDADGLFEVWYPGAGGGAGSQTQTQYPFRLTGNKANSSPTADAQLIDVAGNPITPQTPDQTVADEAARLALTGLATGWVVKQTDTDRLWEYKGGGESDPGNWMDLGPASVNITVVDKTVQAGNNLPAGRYGLANYTDALGVSQLGYVGECRYTGIADYGGTGKPGYEIVSMEGPADELLVKATENGSSSKARIGVTIEKIYGSNEATRTPPEDSGGGFSIPNTGNLLDDVEIDELIEVVRNHATSEYEPRDPGLQGKLFEIVIPIP